MKTRLIFFVLILGFGAIAVGWVYERSLRVPEEKARLSIPDDIDYFMTNMNYRALNSAGKVDFQFYTPRLEHYPHSDVSSLEVPWIRIETETVPWLVDSQAGEYQHANNLLHLTREVVMRREGDSPLQVFTDSIRFEPDREWVTADSEILMLQPNTRIVAEHGEFDLAGQVYKLKRARAVYKNEDS
jgi:LPS export ABC transporter protein LptC